MTDTHRIMNDAGLDLQPFDATAVADRFAPGCRVAVLSMHTSPLDRPGTGDSGGLNVYVRHVADDMARRGIASDIFTRRSVPDEPEVREVSEGVRVIAVPAGPARPVHKDRLSFLVRRFADEVVAHARITPYDVIHAHYWLSGVAGIRLREALDVPLVTSFHTLARVKEDAMGATGPEPLFRKRGEDRVVAASDILVAPTAAERAQLIELYAADPARIAVAPPGVDLETFRPGDRDAARARFGLGDAPTVGFVGRLQQLKGPHVAIDAFARLVRMVPDARLVVVGGDSPRGIRGELRRLRLAARHHGLDERITFCDPLPRADLVELYRAVDALIVPSASESFGLVALEASACGTPVVATAVGGLRLLVRDGETGYLVDGRDPQGFAAALSRVLSDPYVRERLGRNAVRLAARYPWTRTVDALLESYASVVACPGVREAIGMS